MYEEIETTMGELQDGDLVMGSDGEWHEITILPIVEKPIHKVTFSNGSVFSSFDHQWRVFFNGTAVDLTTADISYKIDLYRGCHVGKEDGPTIVNSEYIDMMKCRCIQVDNEDHQFEVLTDEGNAILTRNCAGRLVCGRLGSTASQMALGNSLATAIDGERKGAGIVSVNGVMSNIQYYFESPEWIDKWFESHGLDRNGYEIGKEEEKVEIILEGEEEITIPENLAHYEFEDIEKNVNNNKEQKFENV